MTVDNIDNLNLRIQTLGYPNYGESIMISLRDGKKELYNIITDCYEVASNHNWIDFLPDSTRINAFIWTHPDDDHSLGVPNLLNKFDPECNARIFLPTSLTSELLERNNKTAAIETYNYLKERYNTTTKYTQWNEISVAHSEPPRFLISEKIEERSTNIVLNFKIGFMAPIGAISNRRVDVPIMSSGQMNDLSIFYIAQINSVNYIFGGDLTKQTINLLNDDYLNNCRFVKIPHHGSKDSIYLIDKIQILNTLKCHSVTTTFRDSHPYDVTLDKYAHISECVYCTGKGSDQFGLVDIIYNIKDISKYTYYLRGNACSVHPKRV